MASERRRGGLGLFPPTGPEPQGWRLLTSALALGGPPDSFLPWRLPWPWRRTWPLGRSGASPVAISTMDLASWLESLGRLGWLFIDANDLPVSLAAKLDFAGPSVETLNAYRR